MKPPCFITARQPSKSPGYIAFIPYQSLLLAGPTSSLVIRARLGVKIVRRKLFHSRARKRLKKKLTRVEFHFIKET